VKWNPKISVARFDWPKCDLLLNRVRLRGPASGTDVQTLGVEKGCGSGLTQPKGWPNLRLARHEHATKNNREGSRGVDMAGFFRPLRRRKGMRRGRLVFALERVAGMGAANLGESRVSQTDPEFGRTVLVWRLLNEARGTA
jgi:hypothetical protein